MKQLSEDVDIFKISKSWIQNLKNFKILKISKIMFLVFLDGFDKKNIFTFFSIKKSSVDFFSINFFSIENNSVNQVKGFLVELRAGGGKGVRWWAEGVRWRAGWDRILPDQTIGTRVPFGTRERKLMDIIIIGIPGTVV